MSGRQKRAEAGAIRISFAILVVSIAAICTACSGGEDTLYIYNWSDYVDEDLIDAFTEETGIEVVMDYFDSNESMYAKLQAGATGYDIVFPTTYMVEIMNDSGMLAEVDHEQIPNLQYIDKNYLAMTPDAEMAYSVPYMISSTGLGFLRSEVGDRDEISWSELANREYRGRVTMLNDMRETIGAALKYLGYSYNSTNPDELTEAQDLLIEWKDNIAKFDNDQYRNGLVSGEFYLVHGYSGDILQGQDEVDDIEFLVPQEGTTISIDNMVILKDAENTEAAHAFINYMLRPEVAAQNIEYVYYLAPNTGAYELLSDEIRDNPAVFLPEEFVAKAEILLDLGDDNALYSEVWDAVKAAQ